MPAFTPIHIEPVFDCVHSDMARLAWKKSALEADFYCPEGLLRVSFSRAVVTRILDETFLSTEETHPITGLVPNHFAYEVEGAAFWDSQSFLITDHVYARDSEGFKHYSFITGWTCLDVISDVAPTFRVVPSEE